MFDLNGAQVAIRAGYSPKTADQQASRLLTNDQTQNGFAEIIAHRSERTEVTQDQVVAALSKIAFGEPEYENYEPLSAQDKLAKHLGMYAEKRELTGKDDRTMEINMMQPAKEAEHG